MTVILTQAQVIAVAPTVSQITIPAITAALNDAMAQCNANQTLVRARYFVSQLAYESCDFNATVENLNYSAARLLQVWPSRFNVSTAAQYANNPQALANYVYANRYGNGAAASGDGWNFRGRGYIQLTFRSNYQAASTYLYQNNSLVLNPDQVGSDPNVAAATSAWFWATNNLNPLCDALNFTAVTTAINGSSATVNQRRVYLARATQAIC